MKVLLIAVFLFASAVSAQNSNAVTAGEFIVEPATIHNLGFEWKISGDDNRNATVSVQYRKVGETNWHEFASRIIELMPSAERKCQAVEAITTADYPTPARRPAYSVMSCEKLRQTFGIDLPNWEQSLRLVLDRP